MSRLSKTIHNNPVQTIGQIVNPGNPSVLLPQKGSGPGTSQPNAGNLNPDPIARYREVYNRDGDVGKGTQGALLWGNDSNRTGQDVYNNFVSTIGREPTANELNKLLPVFQGSHEQGLAALANFQDLEGQKPENLMKQAPQHYDSVNQLFQSQLGRQANQQELDHFGTLLASGNTDPYQLQSFLQGTPEYQGQQDTKFRNDFSQQAQGQDLNFFNRAKQDVISQFAKNGTQNSSALDSALTDLMGQIQSQRQNQLLGMSASQYGGNKDLALNNYSNNMNQYLQNQAYNRNTSQAAYQGNVNQSNNIYDYNKQMADYYSHITKPDNSMNWVNTGLNAVRTVASFIPGTNPGSVPQQNQFSYLNNNASAGVPV